MGKVKRSAYFFTLVSSQDTQADDVPFRCETTVGTDRVVVSVFSDIDIASVKSFRAALDAAAAAGKPVTVDLSGCDYLDSTGISTLVGVRNASVAIDVIASRQAAKLLDIVGLTSLLNVTLAQA
jgi:anti-anti-sigma factor